MVQVRATNDDIDVTALSHLLRRHCTAMWVDPDVWCRACLIPSWPVLIVIARPPQPLGTATCDYPQVFQVPTQCWVQLSDLQRSLGAPSAAGVAQALGRICCFCTPKTPGDPDSAIDLHSPGTMLRAHLNCIAFATAASEQGSKFALPFHSLSLTLAAMLIVSLTGADFAPATVWATAPV